MNNEKSSLLADNFLDLTINLHLSLKQSSGKWPLSNDLMQSWVCSFLYNQWIYRPSGPGDLLDFSENNIAIAIQT